MAIQSAEKDALLHLSSRAASELLEPLPPLEFARFYLAEESDVVDLYLAGVSRLRFPSPGYHSHAAVFSTTKPDLDYHPIGELHAASFAVRYELATQEDCLRFGLSSFTSIWYQLLKVRHASQDRVVFGPTSWVSSGQLVYPSKSKL